MGAAGEVHAAHLGAGLQRAAGRKDLAQEVSQHGLQRGKFLREGKHRAALLQVALALHAVHQLRHQTLLQLLVERGKLGQRVGVGRRTRGLDREGEAPDLVACVLGQGLEALVEAADQIGLGHQHIHRGTHAQLGVQLVQPGAKLGGMFGALGCTLLQQVLDVDGQQHAIDGLARPGFFQQRQEVVPGTGVHVAVALLRGVAAGGVHQHRILGEPPIAVAGTAHALHRALGPLGRIAQQELQAGVHQRGGFARARRADEDVPGQLIQMLATAQPRARAAGLEPLHRVVEALRQHLGFFVTGRRSAAQAGQQGGVGLAALPRHPGQAGDPQTPQQRQHRQPHRQRLERACLANGDQRAQPPNNAGERQQTQRPHHQRAQQPLQKALHRASPSFGQAVAGGAVA